MPEQAVLYITSASQVLKNRYTGFPPVKLTITATAAVALEFVLRVFANVLLIYCPL